MTPVMLAFAAAASFGLWTVFHKLASAYVSATFGAILVSAVAVLAGLSVAFFKPATSGTLFSNPKGIALVIVAGVCAFLVDYFTLRSFGSGLSLSVGGPIIIGVSIAIAAVIGMAFLGEPFSWMKILAIGLILVGGSILATY